MTEYQFKAMKLAGRIKRIIFEHLDSGEMNQALRLYDRWELVFLTAFPGEARNCSPGILLNDWYELRVFESRL